ncbi:uncharacterized protein [Arachis hypogaea]|uniref:uncharacterized protein isoform X1 n=1 Tax=Arachis hypogaea TaxID=3818 RepID=UPI003B20E379
MVLGLPGPPLELLATSVVAKKSCRRHDWNSLPLPLEVAAGLPPSRFRDRRGVGSTVPPSVRYYMLRVVLLWLLRKWLGAEVLVACDFKLRRKGLCETLDYGICILRIWAQKSRRVHLYIVVMLCIVLVMDYCTLAFILLFFVRGIGIVLSNACNIYIYI